MNNANPTPYIKAPHLQKIIDADQNCEEKLDSIRALLSGSAGGAPSSQTTSINGGSTIIQSGEASVADVGNSNNYEKVLKEIPLQSDKKVALQLLQEIEKLTHLSWNPENLEMILNNEPEKFTNIALLIKKVVSRGEPLLPIGLTLFIESLMTNKIPFNFLRDRDSMNIRENLMKINSTKGISEGESATEPTATDPAEKVTEINKSTDNASDEVLPGTLKRKFTESSGDELTPAPKKSRQHEAESVNHSAIEEAEPKRSFELPVEKVKHLRRSARLNQDASEAWESQRGNAGSKDNNGKKGKKRYNPY